MRCANKASEGTLSDCCVNHSAVCEPKYHNSCLELLIKLRRLLRLVYVCVNRSLCALIIQSAGPQYNCAAKEIYLKTSMH